MHHILLLAVLLAICPRGVLALDRVLVAVGQNRGLAGDPILRYAEHDAERFAQVMVALGGVEPADVHLRPGLTAEGFRALLAEVRGRLNRGSPDGRELLVYVSSHAADGRLHLGGSELALSELQAFVEEAPAQIGLLFVDACQAGVVTQGKGLVPDSGPVAVLRPRVEGRAFIASARADQRSLESDTLRGSYFTVHLVAGLRGPADSSRDGRVDLSEAFTYAYNRTVEATVGTLPEPQAPSYLQNLRGTGQLVLTDTRLARALVQIAFHPAGRWVVTRLDAPSPVEEFIKAQGEASLAVDVGTYRFASALATGQTVGVEIVARLGDRLTITEESLRPVPEVGQGASDGSVPQSWLTSDRLLLRSDSRSRLNGKSINEAYRTLQVCEGAPIRGAVAITAYNDHDAPNPVVPLVMVASWQHTRTQYKTISRNVPRGESHHLVEIDLAAPRRTGLFHLIFAAGGQTEPGHVAARSSWVDGAPRWDDGLDLADLTTAVLEGDRSEGRVLVAEHREGGIVHAPIGVVSVRVLVRRCAK